MWEPTTGWLVYVVSNAIIFAPRSIRSLPIEAPLSPRRGLISCAPDRDCAIAPALRKGSAYNAEGDGHAGAESSMPFRNSALLFVAVDRHAVVMHAI